jgi:hypothetical protein
MKKIGLLTGLCTVLTVSSVYATWIYAQQSAGSVSESVIPQMAGVGDSSKKGTISVKTSGLTMVIENSGNYKPKLQIDGKIIVEFTPSEGADTSVIENGIYLQFQLSFTSGWVYDSEFNVDSAADDKEIFRFKSSYPNVATEYTTTKIDMNGGAPIKYYEIEASKISEMVELNVDDDFRLDTREKYDAYQKRLNRESSKFTFTVSEKVA